MSNESILAALHEGDIPQLEWLVSLGMSLRRQCILSENLRGHILIAANKPNTAVQMLRWFHKMGATMADFRGNNGRILVTLAYHNCVDGLRFVSRLGIDIAQEIQHHKDVIYWLLIFGHVEAMDWLLKRVGGVERILATGLIPRALDSRRRIEMLAKLREHGLTLDDCRAPGHTLENRSLLAHAIMHGDVDALQFLVAAGITAMECEKIVRDHWCDSFFALCLGKLAKSLAWFKEAGMKLTLTQETKDALMADFHARLFFVD